MIEKTEGIVLRSRPFSRTSRMVTWLTPDYGRVTTVIKGACRPKSFFLGQTDIGYRCELLFYRRERDGAHIAREVCPLDCREGMRANWRASVAAGYVCWLISQVTEPMLETPELYRLLDRALAALADGAEPEPLLRDFEFLLLDLLGVAPKFSFCSDCTLGTERRRSCRFMLADGRVGCIHALSIHHESSDSVALTTSLVDALSAAQAAARSGPLARPGSQEGREGPEGPEGREGREGLGSPAKRMSPFYYLASRGDSPDESPRLAIGIRRFLGLFICHHLDLSMQPRVTAYSWLDWDRYDRGLLGERGRENAPHCDDPRDAEAAKSC